MSVRLGALLFGVTIAAPATSWAQAPAPAPAEEDMEAVEKVTDLNRKALQNYENLEFEEARKLLKQALDLAQSSGLEKHIIMARTHLHMGVVLIASKQRDLGLKQFKKALEIQGDIRVTKTLANPEIEAAFEEARKSVEAAGTAGTGGQAGSGAQAGAGTGGAGGAPSLPDEPPEDEGGLKHRPVTQAKNGSSIPITVTIDPAVTGYAKVVLAYRPEGSADYFARDMQRSGNSFGAEIPADATNGNLVTYYVEAVADDEEETVVVGSGTEEKPHTIVLGSVAVKPPSECEEGDDDCVEEDDDEVPKFFIGMLGGIGLGYVTGYAEADVQHRVNPAGFSPFPTMQVVPEIGYMFSPSFRVSLQMRLQRVSGATSYSISAYEDRQKMDSSLPPLTPQQAGACGPEKLCSPANGAMLILARGTWFFGSSETLRPYFSAAVGGGQIRHLVKFTGSPADCGIGGNQVCVDTVLAGPVFAGPGGGVLFSLSKNFGLLAEAITLVGFPRFTFHVDVHAGVAASF
jgi:hypothetical protein